MIKAHVEERGNSIGAVVEIEGDTTELIVEFKGIVQSMFMHLGKENSLMFALLLNAIDEGVREAMEGEEEENGQSEGTDSEASYEVRFDYIS